MAKRNQATRPTFPEQHAQMAENSRRYLALEDHVLAVRAAYVLLHPLLERTRDLGRDDDIAIGWLSRQLSSETEKLLDVFEGRAIDEEAEAAND